MRTDGNTEQQVQLQLTEAACPNHVGTLSRFDELFPRQIEEPLRGYPGLVPVLDVETRLHDEIDEQPHVVEEHREPEVEQPHPVVIRRVHARKSLIVL